MDLIRGGGWVKASPASTRHQLEHGVGVQENQTISKQKNAERWWITESIITLRAKKTNMMTIQDIYVKSKSVSSWSCRIYVNPIKNLSKKKKIVKRTLILKRVTRVHIFFLDCSTISNNSENDDIFKSNRTTRPRPTPQPLVTTTKSFSQRTQLTNTRNKLTSEGKIYLDGNLTSNMTLVYCWVLFGYRTSNFPPLPVYFKKEGTLNMYYISFINEGVGKGENPMSSLANTLALPLYVWQ